MSTHLGDTPEKRALAAKQRDMGLLNPGDPEYDTKLAQTWGGPPPKWFNEALRSYPASFPAAGSIALVTGSTGGIGFYVAKLLAACGFSLVIPSRPGLLDEAEGAVNAISAAVPGARIEVPEISLDLSSYASVREFAAALRNTHERIDVLCLNAGRGGGVDDPREETRDRQDAIMQVNTTSQFLLVCELLPLLQASVGARIVCQSSGARFNARPSQIADLDGKDRFNGWSQYSLSKACMCTLALSLNERLAASGIGNVIACVSEPGLTSTGVNIQHDLVRSLGLTKRGLRDTNEMHDRAGHHAADGALPMTLAALSGRRDEIFCTDGRQSRSLDRAAFKAEPEGSSDPMLWGRTTSDEFWQRATMLSDARWPF